MADTFYVNDMEDNEQRNASHTKKSSGLTVVLENEKLPDEQHVDLSALVPVTILLVKSIGGVETDLPLRALLDSGADRSQMHVRALKPGMHPHKVSQGVVTTMGVTTGGSAITLEQMILPEFSRTRRIMKPLEVRLFDSPSRYDIIIGRDLLSLLGIKLDFEKGVTTWQDSTVGMRDRDTFLTQEAAMIYFIDLYSDDDDIGDDFMLEAKYDKVDTAELSAQQQHLTEEQRKDLAFLLSERSKLFSGELGLYPDTKVHLNLQPDAKPVHHRPYAVPRNIHTVFKGEIDHLVNVGVLEKCGASEWAVPHFATPKKDGRIRMISDFRSVNKHLRRRVYPLPLINETLRKRNGYKFLTKLDISMQYYTFELDEASKELCVITTPFGKY